jgi:hypothetical protein
MPLPAPYAYIVSYDLQNPVGHYEPLFRELQNSYRWWHYLTTTWIVLRYEALVELEPKLVSLVSPLDRILILPAKGPAAGWLPGEAWAWIRENLPRAW